MSDRTGPDLLTAVHLSDPLRGASDADVAHHVDRARRVVDARRPPHLPAPVTHRRRLRTLAVATAVFVALPLASLIVVPETVSRLGIPWVAQDVVGSATADGTGMSGLSCGGGHATAIRPDRARLRLWPRELPAGWTVGTVFARRTETVGWCTAPSLTLAELGPDGTALGTVKVVGPNRDIRWSGDPELVPDRVAGMPAVRVQYPGTEDLRFQRWVATDRAGSQWEMTVNGYAEATARAVLRGVQVVDNRVTWSAPGSAPAMTAVHERTGAPYANRETDGLEWYLRLHDGAARRDVYVRDRAPHVSIVADLALGERLYEVGGRPALAFSDGAGRVRSLAVEARPGVLASAEVRDDLAEVEAMLASLENLPRDDRRLDDQALREETED